LGALIHPPLYPSIPVLLRIGDQYWFLGLRIASPQLLDMVFQISSFHYNELFFGRGWVSIWVRARFPYVSSVVKCVGGPSLFREFSLVFPFAICLTTQVMFVSYSGLSSPR